jgi:hypothetical protein
LVLEQHLGTHKLVDNLILGENEMIQLVPMTDDEIEALMEISMSNHIQDQVKAGAWRAENAEEYMQKLRLKILPGGLATPNQSFF